MVRYICPKCGHSWNYLGTSKYYITCPCCYRKIRIGKLYKPKIKIEIKEKPTLKSLGSEL